jgi:hypothetical protein
MDGILLFTLAYSTHMKLCNQEHKLKYDTQDFIMLYDDYPVNNHSFNVLYFFNTATVVPNKPSCLVHSQVFSSRWTLSGNFMCGKQTE